MDKIDTTKEQWYGQSVDVKSDPLVDKGTGDNIIIRTFEYSANPLILKTKPTKQELFNSHAEQIKLFLWKDGLEVVEDVSPRIILKDKNYQILVGCKAKKGVAIMEKPQTLQEIIPPEKSNGFGKNTK